MQAAAQITEAGVGPRCRCTAQSYHGAGDLEPCAVPPPGVDCPLQHVGLTDAGVDAGESRAWAGDPPDLWLG